MTRNTVWIDDFRLNQSRQYLWKPDRSDLNIFRISYPIGGHFPAIAVAVTSNSVRCFRKQNEKKWQANSIRYSCGIFWIYSFFLFSNFFAHPRCCYRDIIPVWSVEKSRQGSQQQATTKTNEILWTIFMANNRFQEIYANWLTWFSNVGWSDCCTSARCKYVPVMISRLHIHLKCFHRPISFQRNAEFETIRNHLCFISLVCFALYSLLFIWSFPSQNETIVILFRFYENYCISVVTWMP